MRVIITGGTGLIGKSLTARRWLARAMRSLCSAVILLPAAHTFRQLGLNNVKSIGWDARTDHGWGDLIRSDSAIVNLAAC